MLSSDPTRSSAFLTADLSLQLLLSMQLAARIDGVNADSVRLAAHTILLVRRLIMLHSDADVVAVGIRGCVVHRIHWL